MLLHITACVPVAAIVRVSQLPVSAATYFTNLLMKSAYAQLLTACLFACAHSINPTLSLPPLSECRRTPLNGDRPKLCSNSIQLKPFSTRTHRTLQSQLCKALLYSRNLMKPKLINEHLRANPQIRTTFCYAHTKMATQLDLYVNRLL